MSRRFCILNALLEKYNEYMRLKDCSISYNLADESEISAIYREDAFLHLLGIHKLQDIGLIQLWTDKKVASVKRKDVIKKILLEELTDADVRKSAFFNSISDRYEYFNYDNLTTLNYTDAVIDFDSSIIKSDLKAKYILFEERPVGEFNHMAIATDSLNRYSYIESFFHEKSRGYIEKQKIVPVNKFSIYKPDGTEIVSDTFF